MSTSLRCSSCDGPLPEGVVDGQCPACVSRLLAAARRPGRKARRGNWPKRFGDYELLGRVGVGGMGIVYKARQRRLDRVVALKMIRSADFGSKRDVRRFRTEAEVVSKLDHPHIVPLYEVGARRGRHFFSMLLVESGSLMTHMPRLQKDPRKSAQIMATAARAVHYAHQHGILHRDLKPANILLDAEDQPYVSDFGLARRADDPSRQTQTAAVVGTPSYMAPEQAAGDGARGSPAADIYSLGAILYELQTGQPPFAAETPLATLRQLQEEQPRRPASINRKVNRDLEAICLKCLEKDPARRYPTAEALALDLERFLRDEPITARAGGNLAALARAARRRPIATALLAIGALLLMSLTASSLVLAVRLRGLQQPGPNHPPVVILMDTPAEKGVYDAETLKRGGTNADVLNDRLHDLPVSLVKEPVAAGWHREDYILARRPDLVVIHRSCFFHALNQEFNFPYPDKPEDQPDPKWRLLYETQDDKLIVFIGLVGTANPHTKFLVYSRGTDRKWPGEAFRKNWVAQVEQRFPPLKGRIEVQYITGGVAKGTFSDAEVANETRAKVKELLGLTMQKD